MTISLVGGGPLRTPAGGAAFLWVVALASPLNGQWTPLEARTRTTIVEVQDDGEEQVVQRREGILSRNSLGVELRAEGRVVDGQESSLEAGTLLDRATGNVYRLLYGRKQAYLSQRGAGPVLPPEKTAEYFRRANELSLGQQAIGGVGCHEFRVMSMTTEAPDPRNWERVGTVCRSVEYDLPVKRVSDSRDEHGHLTRTIEELYDIRIGVEPDVEIPDGFQVIDDVTQIPPTNPFCKTCSRDRQ